MEHYTLTYLAACDEVYIDGTKPRIIGIYCPAANEHGV